VTARIYQTADWYDVPRLYDIVFEEDTEKEADFLEAMLDRYGRTGRRRVLEPACGSGRLMEAMARRGYRVTGFDRNPAMVEYTRKRLADVSGRVFEARMEGFSAKGTYELAHCLVSTFKYVGSEAGAVSHLRAVARALVPGGLYVLGLHLSQYGLRSRTRERWVGARNGTTVICNIQQWPANRQRRTEQVRSRLIVTTRGEERRYETNWMFRTYDASQLRALFRAVPSLEHVATYDFTYELGRERVLNDDQLDVVAVLQKR
jgi:SAM-dependent methyltransferase